MFWNLVIAIASFALNLVLAPKPQNAKPASVDDFNVPTADESREIPWLFGTKDLTGPNVHWWGHLKADAIHGPRRYGLFGPRQTIGHNYYLGMHVILCHGVADAVYRIKAGDNDLWKGINKGGRVSVKGKAGGNAGTISGSVDIEMGAPNQGQNDYLKARLGADVPAFRGVVGAVLRRPNMGETPYLAPWSFQTQRIFKKWDGSPQWYPEKAGIGGDGGAPKLTVNQVVSGPFGTSQGDLATDMNGGYLANIASGKLSVWKFPNYSTPLWTKADIAGQCLSFDDNGNLFVVSGTVVTVLSAKTGAVKTSFTMGTGDANIGISTFTDGAAAYVFQWRSARLLLAKVVGSFATFIGEISPGYAWVFSTQAFTVSPTRVYALKGGIADSEKKVLVIPWTELGFGEPQEVVLSDLTATPVSISYIADLDVVIVVDGAGGIHAYNPSLSTRLRTRQDDWSLAVSSQLRSNRSVTNDGRVVFRANAKTTARNLIVEYDASSLSLLSMTDARNAGYVESINSAYEYSAVDSTANVMVAVGAAGVAPLVAWGLPQGDGVDMNPAHIIRECLTDPIKGMGYKESDMGASWVAAADTLYNEGFGLTLLWQREEEIGEFVQMIQSHIDAYVYVDRRTGKFEIKLIRNDYDIDAIPVVTDEDIISVEEVRRRQPAEAVTSVTAKYFDRKQGKDGIYVAHNPAQVQLSEGTVPITRHYAGVQTMELASRLAERDLHALSSGFADGNIVVKRTLSSLNPGDPFRLFSERLGFSGEVMRVTEIKLGDGRSNAVRLKFVQDVFGLDADPLIIDEGSEWENPSTEPAPVERRLVHEMPYRELLQAVGEANAASMLAANPDAGLVQYAGGSPTDDSIQATVAIDEGTGYEDLTEALSFAPSALVNGALGALATSLAVRGATDLDLVAVGSLASVGDEIVRVDAIAGDTLTIGRGCLDTVPHAHADGAPVIFFDDFSDSDVVERSAGASISVKLKTETGRGELDEAEAPADTVTFASRAIKPYRNANVAPAGPVDATGLSIIPVTWARRNRLTETTPLDWTAADQAPEVGQTTTLTLSDPAGVAVHAYIGITGTSHNVSKADFGELEQGYIVVSSERDGHASWQPYRIPVILATPGPSDILIDNDTVSVSATTGTVVGTLSTVGGMAPITFEIIS